MDRDLEIHRLTTRLGVLRRYGLDLCLGHIVRADDPRAGLRRSSRAQRLAGGRLLLDWRSPAAEPFFAATHANPMGLASRRRYRWSDGRISDYWDEVFTPDGLDQPRGRARRPVGVHRQPGRDPLVADAGRARHDPGRPGRDHPGGFERRSRRRRRPGHRQDGRRPAPRRPTCCTPTRGWAHRRGGVLFVGPHQPYLDYVADVLPSLGEEGVRTVHAARTGRRGRRGGAGSRWRDRPAEVFGRHGAARSSTAVRFHEEPPTAAMTVTTPWADVRLDAEDWAEAFEAPEPATPHNDAREVVWQELLTILTDKHERDGDTVSADQIRRSLQRNGELLRCLQPRLADARRHRCRRRPLVGARLPAPVRPVAAPGGRARAAEDGRPGLDRVRPPVARRRPPPDRRSGWRRGVSGRTRRSRGGAASRWRRSSTT